MESPSKTPTAPPPGAWAPAFALRRRLSGAVDRFLAIEAASGVVLLAVALLALLLANSPWATAWQALWHSPLGLHLGPWSFERDLHFWINDGLMAVFFFVVGLEIRREVHRGELSELRRAALPLAAALGGMVAPALIYTALNRGGVGAIGWGVPMATDIAFAVGVLALLGRRVPPALRILLLALAVIDDLGAVLVIALFYSTSIQVSGLLMGAAAVGLVLLQQRLGARSPLSYLPAALALWAGLYQAGIHPTLAGVILGMMTPVVAWEGEEAEPPGERLIHALHGMVAWLIMPLFALANAGVALGAAQLSGEGLAVFLGVVLGLALGKPLGVVGLSWLFVRAGLAELPRGVGWRGVAVVGLVAGIGFTMSLFVAGLAFPPGSLLETARLAILCGSGLMGIIGVMGGLWLLPATPAGGARSAAEAESSTAL